MQNNREMLISQVCETVYSEIHDSIASKLIKEIYDGEMHNTKSILTPKNR